MGQPRNDEELARAVLAVSEAYCGERRCALVAPGASDLAEALLRAGARSVHHYATDDDRRPVPLRLDRTLLVRPLPAGDFDVREGAFDLVVVASLAALGDVGAWLGRFRRLVGASGVFVAGAPRADGGASHADGPRFSVHELDELLAVQFGWVDLRGLAPFHGMVVAPIGAPGSVGDFVLHPLDDGRAAPESLVVVASQKTRALEPTLLLELEPRAPAVVPSPVAVGTVGPQLAPVAVANDGSVAELEARLREREIERQKAAEERADLLDTIALREAALRDAESEGDRLRREIDTLTGHLDRALAGAVPAHLARLEALADKDRPRVVEAPLAVAERERLEAEIVAADAARTEADDACLRLEGKLRHAEAQRKQVERTLAEVELALDEREAEATALAGELAAFEEQAAAELAWAEARVRELARVAAEDRAHERAVARMVRAETAWRTPSAGFEAAAGVEDGARADEGALVRALLAERARADLAALEIRALRARLARIVDAVDDAASSAVDTEASDRRLTPVSLASAASSLRVVPGSHSNDG
jgi:hypothetical protein